MAHPSPASEPATDECCGGDHAPRGGPSAPASGAYTCPMHPEVRQSGPGHCPDCGMSLEADIAAGAIYVCPMHPEVRQAGPGNCPICGMALEPEVATGGEEGNAELADMTRRFWIGLVLTL